MIILHYVWHFSFWTCVTFNFDYQQLSACLKFYETAYQQQQQSYNRLQQPAKPHKPDTWVGKATKREKTQKEEKKAKKEEVKSSLQRPHKPDTWVNESTKSKNCGNPSFCSGQAKINQSTSDPGTVFHCDAEILRYHAWATKLPCYVTCTVFREYWSTWGVEHLNLTTESTSDGNMIWRAWNPLGCQEDSNSFSENNLLSVFLCACQRW